MQQVGTISDIEGKKDVEEPSKEVAEVKTEAKVEPDKSTEPVEETQEIDWETRAKKAEEERDNYKTALLIQKGKKPKKEAEEESPWDETSAEFQKDTMKRVDKLVQKKFEDKNELLARKKFINKHKSELTEALWGDTVTSYKPQRGRENVKDIQEDLEDAYLLSKRKHGLLVGDLEKARQEGERAGAVKAKTAQMASVSGAGNHSVSKTSSQKGLSDNARLMAEKMKTPIDKLEAETGGDDSAVIKF